ncbi:MAG: hypothetical protein ACJA0P_001012 [Planctomycetota bacterium]|jgi:hypothetical protein
MNKILLPSVLLLSLAATANVSFGQLTNNGDFELGDTSGWQAFLTPNATFTITNDVNGGSFAAVLDNPDPAAGAVIKQANVGAGSVSPGDQVRISFAAKGSGMVGGVAFAEFFSEIQGGGISSAEILSGGPLQLTDEWQTFCYTATAGSDVSGGVTLQIGAITGAATGSQSTVFIDDVSMTITELATNGGFESGDTGGWAFFPGPNTTFNAVMDPNTGTFAGEINNPDPAVGAVIKQANVGVGVVQPGDTLNVSFAAKGANAIGGILFAEFFSEIAGGGVSSQTFLGGGPVALTADWQTFTYQVDAGSDVSGGVTLQFVAVTGAAVGSFSNATIDDVTISTTAGTTLNYCSTSPNSVGTGATITSSGSPSVANQDFVIEANGLPANTFALLFVGTGTTVAANFNGAMCVSNTCRIGPILSSSASGTLSRDLPDSAYTQFGCTPPVIGSQLFFQLVYRDSIGTGGNWTDALCVVFGE